MILVIRAILVVLYIGIVGLLGFLYSLLRPFNTGNVYPFANLLSKAQGLLGVELEDFDIHHLDNRPCVYVSNHQHNLDIIVYSHLFRPKTVTLGKKSIRYVPFFGLFYWFSGNILIDRSNKKKALETMNSAVEQIASGTSVWVMPEGTRSKGRGLLPFKKGAFHLAIEAQVPIVPICYSNYVDKLNLNSLKKAKVKATVLPPVPTKGLSKEDIDSLIEKIYNQMNLKIKELDSLS